jgi:putative addiction module component (TIGR02574 family)
MATNPDELAAEVLGLSDLEKLRLVDTILDDLDHPDPAMDRIWAEEARKRWAAHKAGRLPAEGYEEIRRKAGPP